MGQQQLLLLVLSAIIVGVSIVIGINMFASSAVQANQDAIMQDCLHIAARAQEWFRKPTSMGGGNRSFDSITMTLLNLPTTNANTSAPFALTSRDTALEILGTGTEGTPLTVRVVVGASGIDTTQITP